MFLIIKVNVSIDLRLFRVHWNRYRPLELKKNYRGGGLPAYEKCLSLKVALPQFPNFSANWGILSLDASFWFSNDMMKADTCIISDNFRVNQKLFFSLKSPCDFCWKVSGSKFTCHLLFLQFNSPVSKQFPPWCYAQVLIHKKTCE